MRRLAVALILLAITGCAKPPDGPIEIRTDPYNSKVCPANRATSGRLVTDDTWGLALRLSDGDVHGVIWPFLYSARRQDGVPLLVNDAGKIEAREGDPLEVGATIDDDGVIHIYCSLVRNLA